jgi:hypothetical protein
MCSHIGGGNGTCTYFEHDERTIALIFASVLLLVFALRRRRGGGNHLAIAFVSAQDQINMV